MRYSISLRCSGGDPDVAALSAALELPVMYHRRKGDAIEAVGGKTVGSVRENFVSYRLPKEYTESTEFEEALDHLLDKAEAAVGILKETRETGAEFDLYVILRDAAALGIVLQVDTLVRLGTLKLKMNVGIE